MTKVTYRRNSLFGLMASEGQTPCWQSKSMAEGAVGSRLKAKARSRKPMTNDTSLLTLKVTFKATPLKPPSGPCPKHHQQLGTKYSNVQDDGRQFFFETPHSPRPLTLTQAHAVLGMCSPLAQPLETWRFWVSVLHQLPAHFSAGSACLHRESCCSKGCWAICQL